MIQCPWCGTNYTSFQSNCSNCGGALPLPSETEEDSDQPQITIPPLAPREAPRDYLWRILSADPIALTGAIFLLIGVIFGGVGIVLTAAIITIFIGIPFAFIGVLMTAIGLVLILGRYQQAKRLETVYRDGQAILGEISAVHPNLNLRVHGRQPWTIEYHFETSGQEFYGKASSLMKPDLAQQPGKPVYVLFAPEDPAMSILYPIPFGYYGI